MGLYADLETLTPTSYILTAWELGWKCGTCDNLPIERTSQGAYQTPRVTLPWLMVPASSFLG